MKVDVERIKRLYEEYGSLEKAVSTKHEELKKASGELKMLQHKLQEETRKLENVKRDAEQLKAEVDAARRLKKMGYNPTTLKLIIERTEGCGSIEALLKNLTYTTELSKLNEQLKVKTKELKNLDSQIKEKRAELNSLNRTIKSRKKLRENLEKTVSKLKGSLKPLTDAAKELKPEVSRLRTEKSMLEDQLQTLNQQISRAREQHENLTREIGGLEEKQKKLEALLGDLTAEANTLKEKVEAQKREVELGKAITTLLEAKTPEDIKQFRAYVEQIEEYIMRQPRSEESVEAAKAVIVKRLMSKFAVFECLNCHTRYIIDSTRPVNELEVRCPLCHFSSMQRSCTSYALKTPKREVTQDSL